MRNIWAIACLTFKDCIRKKVLIVVAVAALVIIASVFFPTAGATEKVGWGAEAGAADRLRLIETWSIYSITFFGVLLSIFLAASDLPREIEFKTIFNVLTKPVRHSQYLAGKILGFCLMVGLVVLLLGVLAFALISITAHYVPTHELVKPLTPSDRRLPVQCHIAPRDENIAPALGSEDYWLFAPAQMRLEFRVTGVDAVVPDAEPIETAGADVAMIYPERVTIAARVHLVKPGSGLSQAIEGTRPAVVKLRPSALSSGEIVKTVEVADGDELRATFDTETNRARLVSQGGLVRAAIGGAFKDGFLMVEKDSLRVITPNGKSIPPNEAQVIPNDGDQAVASEPGTVKIAYLFEDLVPESERASFKVRLAMLNLEDAQRRYDISLAAIDPSDPSRRISRSIEDLSNGHWASFDFDSSLISPDGRLVVEVASDPGNYHVGLPSGMVRYGDEKPAGERELAKVALSVKYYPFIFNYLKSMLLLFLSFALVIFIGVAGSTFLSGPVSVTVALFVYFCGTLTEQISDIGFTLRYSPEMGLLGMGSQIIERGSRMSGFADRINQFASILVEGLLRILPDFQVFGTRQMVVGAVNIPAANVVEALRVFGIWAAGSFILAYIVFKFREVAK